MDDYSLLLALSYLNQYKEKYILSELMQILGMTTNQFDILLSELFEHKYIVYNNYILSVTALGKAFLTSSNMYDYDNLESNTNLLHVDPEKAMSIDEVYIPKKILRKK